MESGSGDAMVVVQLECEVQEGDRASWDRGFPFESCSRVAKGVHGVEKGGMGSRALLLDDEGIIDQVAVE